MERLRYYPANGHRSVCRVCEAKARRERYATRADVRTYHLSQASLSRRKKRGEPGGVTPEDLAAVLARPTCEYCLYPNDGSIPVAVDHAQPVSRGGHDQLSNLRLSCKPCNQGKGTMTEAEYRTWLRALSDRLNVMYSV